MKRLPAIPDPGPAVDTLDVAGVLAVLDELDLGTADEYRLRAQALADYLATRGDQGPANRIANMACVRIGHLLGDPADTNGRPLDPDQKAIDGALRHWFRLMARYRPVVEDNAHLTREKVLALIRRKLEHKAEQEARAIAIGGDDADSGAGWTMLGGDFRERLEPYAGLVDLIVTDPPYAAEFAPVWSDLAEQATRVLRPQGILVVLTGKIMLPDVLARLGEHLAYGWCYCQPLPGSSSRILARHVGQEWKPWLAYSRGAWPSGRIDWHPDLLDGERRVKDRYRWQQQTGPAVQLIDYLAPTDGLVLDPFAGTGSYGVAALTAGRRFLGVEADEGRYEACRQRLAEHEQGSAA